jgi:hypothetical protein
LVGAGVFLFAMMNDEIEGLGNFDNGDVPIDAEVVCAI